MGAKLKLVTSSTQSFTLLSLLATQPKYPGHHLHPLSSILTQLRHLLTTLISSSPGAQLSISLPPHAAFPKLLFTFQDNTWEWHGPKYPRTITLRSVQPLASPLQNWIQIKTKQSIKQVFKILKKYVRFSSVCQECISYPKCIHSPTCTLKTEYTPSLSSQLSMPSYIEQLPSHVLLSFPPKRNTFFNTYICIYVCVCSKYTLIYAHRDRERKILKIT